ncbi:sulfite oxidase [Neobacillus sp. LXY-4]|uniref:sulfite oxidase n=1 Tax=Neobacillus sp. LXY-4 TaxID=3379826 RepID=UPI003EE35797
MERERIVPFLTTRSLEPENQESPIHFLNYWQTPTKYFYLRNHFPYPFLTQNHLWLQISGQVRQPRYLHYYEIISMPTKSIVTPLECAGNKRNYFVPKVYGEQWEDGAISQGKWTGIPLIELLKNVGVSESAKEIVFHGADSGKKPGVEGNIHFARSLPIEKALHPDTLIAFQYNDQPLSLKHGFPFRLIVPNWYGMASVKWLSRLEVIDRPFEGHFQTEDYVYYPQRDKDKDRFPVTTMNINSTILQPLHLTILPKGSHEINGIAWTGEGVISEVEISFDKGDTWRKTTLHKNQYQTYAWVNWSYNWDVGVKGEYTIYSRAKDTAGRIQPLTAFWNQKGYGYNAVSIIKIKVE